MMLMKEHDWRLWSIYIWDRLTMNHTNKTNGVFDRTIYHDLDTCAEGYLKLKPDFSFRDWLATHKIERFY